VKARRRSWGLPAVRAPVGRERWFRRNDRARGGRCRSGRGGRPDAALDPGAAGAAAHALGDDLSGARRVAAVGLPSRRCQPRGGASAPWWPRAACPRRVLTGAWPPGIDGGRELPMGRLSPALLFALALRRSQAISRRTGLASDSR